MILSDKESKESCTSSSFDAGWDLSLQPGPSDDSWWQTINATNRDLFDTQGQERPMTRQLLLRFQRSQENSIPMTKDLPGSAKRLPPTRMVVAGLGLLFGTCTMSCILSEFLAQWEWFQLWRYTWPFGIGALYLIGNVLPQSTAAPEDPLGPMAMRKILGYNNNLIGQSTLSRAILIMLSLGMMIGGAYDVWMPVYMTGPNVLTAAGIGQDAAVGLFLWTFWQTMVLTPAVTATATTTIHSSITTKSSWFLISSIVLLAELYKLGEGSWDELVFSKVWPL